MRHAIALITIFAAGSALACATSPPTVTAVGVDSSVGAGDGGGSDAGSDSPPPDAVLSDADAGASPPLVGIRIAQWSSGSPAVDVCLATHGSNTFKGPMLENAMAAQGDEDGGGGGAPGLSFPEVTSYFLVPPGQYDARFVVAGADCSVGIISDATGLPPLGMEDGLETIALMGNSQVDAGPSALRIQGFLDDALVTTAGVVAVRFINAAPDVPSADVGTGLVITPSGSTSFTFNPMFDGVTYGQHSTLAEADPSRDLASGSANVDPRGYMFVTPLDGAAMLVDMTKFAPGMGTVGVRRTGTQAVLAQEGEANLAAGAVVTLVLLDTTSATAPEGGAILADGLAPVVGIPSAASGIALLQCIDNAGSLGLLADCAVVAP
jgi:hypothetical protein